MDGERKYCKKCGEFKLLTDFYRASENKDGRRGECIACAKVIRRRWYDANHEKAVVAAQRWAQRNPDRVAAYREEYRNRPERKRAMRDLYYRRTFGITADDVDALIEKQCGKCAICEGVPARAEGWHVDHDHATSRIRGVLCQRCNHGIGLLDEDPARLRAAAEYLESANR
jgi:Autographiviridae endonuclease VII